MGDATSGWDVLESIGTVVGALGVAVTAGIALWLGRTARRDEMQRAERAHRAELAREQRADERRQQEEEALEMQEARRVIVRPRFANRGVLSALQISVHNMSRQAILDVHLEIEQQPNADHFVSLEQGEAFPSRIADAIPPLSSASVSVLYDPLDPVNSALATEPIGHWMRITISWTDYHKRWRREQLGAPEIIGTAGP